MSSSAVQCSVVCKKVGGKGARVEKVFENSLPQEPSMLSVTFLRRHTSLVWISGPHIPEDTLVFSSNTAAEVPNIGEPIMKTCCFAFVRGLVKYSKNQRVVLAICKRKTSVFGVSDLFLLAVRKKVGKFEGSI